MREDSNLELNSFLEKLKDSLDYNPETGEFRWKVSVAKSACAGALAGTVDNTTGRLRLKIGNKRYLAHRLAWLLTHNTWPECMIDHIDGNPLNNRINNLRDVSRVVNSQNQKHAHSRNKTGLLGVHCHHTKYSSSIRVSGKLKHLGYFTTPEEAHTAYLAAKRELHEGCTI